MKKELENLSIKEAKEKLEEYGQLCELFGKELKQATTADNPYVVLVGKNIFIRTVTMAYTGKLLEVYPNELVLGEAAWIADTGRFTDFLKEGKVNEVEPFPDKAIVPRGAIVDVSEWKHDLLRNQK